MVGGGFEEERNTNQNGIREERLLHLIELMGLPKNAPILDFGCGHGLLMLYLIENGFDCDGYDKYNPKFDYFEIGKKYNIITMVEVVEHISYPFEEIDVIRDMLAPNGVLYVETSFVDVAKEEKIPLDDFFYINPEVGHSTIFSHLGLDILMLTKGFRPLEHFNRNARIFQKLNT